MKAKKTIVQLIALFLLELMILYPVTFVQALSISGINATDIGATSAKVKWFTDEVADGRVRYGPTADLGFTSRHTTFIFEHSQLLQGLDPEKTYLFKIESTNINGQTLTDDNKGQLYSFTTKDITPPQKVSGLSIVSKTKSSITISWQPSSDADLDHYNVYRNQKLVTSVKDTALTDASLEPATSYSYKVSAVDASENEGAQSNAAIASTEALDLDAPLISDVDIASIEDAAATINWATAENSTSAVYFGAGSLDRKQELKKMETNHSITITGLEKGVSYSFVVSSCDKEDNCANSTLQKFEAGFDTKAPGINASIPRFVNENIISIAGSTEPFSSVRLFVNDLNLPARALDSRETPKGTFEFRGVRLQKENVIKLLATDKAGNKNESIFRVSVDTENPVVIIDQLPSLTSKKNLTIVGTVDEPVFINFFLRFGSKERPEKITGLKADAKNSSIALEWNETKDKDFSHYIVYRKDVGPIAITSSKSYNSYTDLLVNKGKEYSYWVTAVDKFGKESEKSDAVAVKVAGGRSDIPKPAPIEALIIEKPDLSINANTTFSESLMLGKDGIYTLMIEVLDRASNRVVIEREVALDTKKPDIKITNPPSGTMIFENYANEMDIKGVTEPNSRVHLFVGRTPLGPLNRSAGIAGLPDDIFNIDDSRLEADCALKIGGKNFCPESADFSTTADGSGNFEFGNVDLTSIASAGFGIEQVSGAQLAEERRAEESKASRLVFIATDPAGLRNAKEHTIRIGTCWSGNQSFDIIPLTEFQSPTFISPQRLAENKESIYFFFNYTYIGRGTDAKIEPNGVSIQKACSGTETLGDKRFNVSCRIIPSGAYGTAVNPEGKVTYTQIKLDRIGGMDRFLENDWKDFFNSVSNELTFPLKIRIRYKHTVDGKQIIETQTTCQEVTYVLDNSLIDPRSILPDWILYDAVDILQNSIETINKVNQQLTKVVELVAVGCVSSFILRLPAQFYRRFITFGEEKVFLLKDITSRFSDGQVKFNVKNDEDQQYCNKIAENIKKEVYKVQGKEIKNPLFGVKLKDFSDKDLKRCFPNVADAWDTEAALYNYYRWTCDRVFGHQTPSAWTENLDDEKIYQRVLEGNQCPNDRATLGHPIEAVECIQLAGTFPRARDKEPGKLCFVIREGASTNLYELGQNIEGDIYRLTVVEARSKVTEKYAIKSQGSERAYLTNRPETCEQLCTGTAPGLTKDTAILDGKTYSTYPKKKDTTKKPNEPTDPLKKVIPVCETSARCIEWSQQGEQNATFEDKEIEISSAKRLGYTQNCFFPGNDPATVSVNPQTNYECCCLNTQRKTAPPVYYFFEDVNRYENDKLVKESAFESKKAPGSPESPADMKWSYRYWKEKYIALGEDKESGRFIQHYQYNPSRYMEGRDYPACFGQNNYLYDGSIFSPAPAEGEAGKLVMIDSRQQLESTFFCANIAGIKNRLVMLNNMQSALASCLIDIRETGTSDAAACKEIFTRYVCSSVWQVVNFAQSLFSGSCSISPLAIASEDEDDYTATISGGFKAVTQSITDAQSEIAGEYGNVQLNNFLGSGAGEIARKVCLGAFGSDWDLNFQNIIDAAYSQSFETLVQKATGTREYLTIDPTSGQARYEYRSSWIINPGCDIESYKAELACISRSELSREGASIDLVSKVPVIGTPTRGIRCDAVGSPDGNNCDCLNLDKEQTRPFFTSKGKLPQNKLVQQAWDEVVSSLYRYDHLKLTLRPDRKIKGSLIKTCFPPGHEDGVFYFPLSDKTARDIAACKLEPVSGVFECTGALDFWSKKGLANIVDITINGEKAKDNSFTVFKGEPLLLSPTIFRTPGSPNKCLVMELEKQGIGLTSQVETINVDGVYQYPAITLDENVQPVQNLRNLPLAEFIACQSTAQTACPDIVSRQKPTVVVLQRSNTQEIELTLEFIDENGDGSIAPQDESSQDKMEVSVAGGGAADSKILGKTGWFDMGKKRPVIDLPQYGIKLQINSVPFASGVKSVTYRQIVPSTLSSPASAAALANQNIISDNIWRLRLSLFEADENTFMCSRYNSGELVQYQGTKQKKEYTIRVAAQSLDADAPRATISIIPAEIKQSGETARLTVDVTDETKVGRINFELAKPGNAKSDWDAAIDDVKNANACVPGTLQGSGDRKVCSIDVDGGKLGADIAGIYRVTVTADDEDRVPHPPAIKEATIEVLCGPSSDNSYGVCMQGGRCGRENVIDSPIACQQGFECCRRFQS